MNKSFSFKISIWVSFFLWLTLSPLTYASTLIDNFFSPPLIYSMALRPDGKAVLMLKEEKGIQYLSIRILDDNTEKKLFIPSEYGDKKSVIKQFVWLDNQYFAVDFIEPKTGIADLMETKISQRLLIVNSYAEPGSMAQVLGVKTSGWLVNPKASDKDEFFYAKSGAQSHIYKLRASLLKPERALLGKSDLIDGGQFIASNKIAQVEGYATRWFFNNDGNVKAVLYFTEPYILALTELKEGKKQEKLFSWTLINKSEKNTESNEKSIEKYIPIALGPSDGQFYCIDRDDKEIKSLYLVNFKEKTQELVYETANFDIVDLVFADNHKLIGVKILKNERVFIEPISSEISFNSYNEKNEKFILKLSESFDSNKKLIYEESYNQSGQFWLETQSPYSRVLLGEKFPQLNNQLKSQQYEGEITVDKLNIPFILNLPGLATKAPLIVMPHGGPIGVFDTPYFDRYTQLFNAYGYAVLRVNFRGSSGRSKEHRDAGKKEWGGLMLKDIHQVTEHAVKTFDIDKNRVCLFGSSYGGYAAVMLLIKHPDMYKCAVAIAGVYDVNLELQSPQLTLQQREWLKEYVGDFEKEYDFLKTISPVYLAEQLQRPILLLHGDKDTVVDIEQSSRLKMSLDNNDKAVSFIVLKNAGHSIESVEDAKKLLIPSLDFLHSNL